MSGTKGLRIAVEGCGHGTLHAIYASVQKSCREKEWDGIDLLIIGGDFQAVRNARDLNCMAVPLKYREMGDFHEYYSGQRVAPYLTIFVGGNHEASNHLFELFYGGWVAPNIYYMGAANVLKLGSLRIAGLSGIWKGHDYNKPHFERLPYNNNNIRSIYHTREIDTRKLLNIKSQVDVGMSHDWPRGVEWLGDSRELFGKKKHLKPDADAGQLGNVAARKALDYLRPSHWFAAHLHVKYAAICHHNDSKSASAAQVPVTEVSMAPTIDTQAVGNKDEIDLDLDDEPTPLNGQANGAAKSNIEEPVGSNGAISNTNSVSDDIRSQLPASFSKPAELQPLPEPPTEIYNTTTNFLALDKCLPGHEFLQLLEIKPLASPSAEEQDSSNRPLRLEYDPEWLAITRVFAPAIRLGTGSFNTPRDEGRGRYAPQIDTERSWIEEHVVKPGKLAVPNNFEVTAPIYDASETVGPDEMPREFNNAQTQTFCDLVGITNPCPLTEKELASRMAAGPPAEENSHASFGARGRGNNRGHRGSRGFRGGRGRGRGYR